jgi:hypothetical protein
MEGKRPTESESLSYAALWIGAVGWKIRKHVRPVLWSSARYHVQRAFPYVHFAPINTRESNASVGSAEIFSGRQAPAKSTKRIGQGRDWRQ